VQRFGSIIVVGGGCYGGYYVRQLQRAQRAGAVAWGRLVVVDRDAACAVASTAPDAVTLRVAEWSDFFAGYLSGAAADPAAHASDAIVPSPLMPHLMFDWLLERSRQRAPGRNVRQLPLDTALDVPWQRQGDDGTRYLSFATWTCPINCIEPAKCPHTRGPRDWSMPTTIEAHVRRLEAAGRPVAGPAVLHVTHRSHGVGMFDTRDVVAADALLAHAARAGTPVEVIVATTSHCHAAAGIISLG
jgi:hypothetical protein